MGEENLMMHCTKKKGNMEKEGVKKSGKIGDVIYGGHLGGPGMT